MRKTMMCGLLFVLFFSLQASLAWAQVDHSNFRDNAQCFECHGKVVNKATYESSKHGNMPCVSCHDFSSGEDNQGQGAITEKCEGCHGQAAADYNQSVHQGGSGYGPDCADCHGSHDITSANEADSPMNKVNLAESCGSCHSRIEESYKETFHGKAVALGSEKSPDCVYCHGSHLILSSKNPESLTSPEKKTELCAKCHEGETLGAGAIEHYTLEPTGFSAPMYWVKKVFMWLILLVVGFFLIHIILELIYKLRKRKSQP